MSSSLQSERLLAGIQCHLGDPKLDMPGFNLFSFNDLERTERWRQGTRKKLNGGAC